MLKTKAAFRACDFPVKPGAASGPGVQAYLIYLILKTNFSGQVLLRRGRQGRCR